MRQGRMRVAVLLSGRGSNLQALIDACRDPGFPAEIALVVSNRADAYGLERAADAGIPARTIEHGRFADRAAFDAAVDTALRQAGVELICLAGFMRIFTPDFVRGWEGRILNIHPSLLPAFPGTRVHERVIEAGQRISGCTVHVVTADLDAGPVLVQAAVPVLGTDDAASLAARVLVQEHLCYPLAVRLVAEGRVRIEGPRAIIRDARPSGGAILSPAPN
jgi:phosphoribosylglycinamide formyltransferase 1